MYSLTNWSPAFPLEAEAQVELQMDEKLRAKYDLQETEEGLLHEVFVRVVTKLSGAKQTKLGGFRSYHESTGLSCSLKVGNLLT